MFRNYFACPNCEKTNPRYLTKGVHTCADCGTAYYHSSFIKAIWSEIRRSLGYTEYWVFSSKTRKVNKHKKSKNRKVIY